MDSSAMESGKNLSLNDFVSAQVEQLNKVLVDHPTHPLEKISLIRNILCSILELVQKKYQLQEGPVLENVEYFWRLTTVMKVIHPFLNSFAVTMTGMTSRQDYDTGDDQSWTKIRIIRALVDLKQLGQILNRLTPPLVIGGPMEESTYFAYSTLDYLRLRTLSSISHCGSELTLFLRQIDFSQYLDNTSKAGILANCPDDHCAICLVEKLTVDLEFTVLNSCRHIFCTSCIKSWLENENWCPMCRGKVDWTEDFSKSTYNRSCKDIFIAASPLLMVTFNQILWHGITTVISFLLSKIIFFGSVPED